MYYIDTDNALGSRSGDVDDSYALLAAILSGLPIAAIGSISGNTDECSAYENNQKLLAQCHSRIPVLRQSEVSSFFAGWKQPLKVLALGPLTNIAGLMDLGSLPIEEVIAVGGNSQSKGKYPPYWPYEYNLVKDKAASVKVLNSHIPIKLVPLNIARNFQISSLQVRALPGKLGTFLYKNSERWFFRSRLLLRHGYFPIWDLLAIFYAIDPTLFKIEVRKARVHPSTWIEWGQGEKTFELVQDFDSRILWEKFERLFVGRG